MLKKLILTTAVGFFGSLSLFADSEGEKLEKQMWADMKHYNWSTVENRIADSFQGVHQNGTTNKEEEVALIKGLYLGNYKISDMKVTDIGDTLIVSYLIAASETIDDKRLGAMPTPRLSVWKKVNGDWKWIAHANLNPLEDTRNSPVKTSKQ